jgi:glutamine phosphoribosylpyrophosphate amidotransferase
MVSVSFLENQIDNQLNFFLKGNLGIGHTRYSTTGGSEVQLAQPFVVHTSYGTLSVAHNGELVNSKNLRKRILESGQFHLLNRLKNNINHKLTLFG